MKKNVVITGGSSGIGLAAVKKFKDEGFNVFELSRHGKSSCGVTHIDCDVTDEKSVAQAFLQIEKAGGADILINNAGFGISGAAEYTELSSAKAQFDVNFFGALLCAKAALPLLRKSRGRIVFISSAAAIFSIPFQAFYSASKSAVNSLAFAMRNELKKSGVSVTALMPGDVKTSFTSARQISNAGSEEYGGRMEKALKTMENDEQNGMSPEYIAKKIFYYSVKRRVGAKYTIGAKYRLFCAVNKVLPFPLVNMLIGKIYGG